MRLVCPACAATYEVPEQKLRGRTSVRCARCGDSWVPEALARPALAEPPALPEPEPEPELEPQPALVAEPAAATADMHPVVVVPSGGRLLMPEWAPPPSPALPIAWGVSLAAVLCGLAFLLMDHSAIAAAWPPMQRLYGLIRLS
jgi:predicted Zn finger-like uncharacterized protein